MREVSRPCRHRAEGGAAAGAPQLKGSSTVTDASWVSGPPLQRAKKLMPVRWSQLEPLDTQLKAMTDYLKRGRFGSGT